MNSLTVMKPARFTLTLILILFILVSVLAAAWLVGQADEPKSASLFAGAAPETSGFSRTDGPRLFQFPEDHGAHPNYQTEWWYYTGNLQSSEGQRFGYQLTFFRRALLPEAQIPERDSGWATAQVYMAHFALTDAVEGEHQAYERLGRGAAGLAGAQAEPFEVWLDDWLVERVGPGEYRLYAAEDDLALELTLTERKEPVLQGDQGYSRKGPQAGQASYYYSLTRLESRGEVRQGSTVFQVQGWSWMDHEFSTSALSANQVGWDWFALQFSDGTELMVFQIRQEDGSVDPFSSGTFITEEGKTVPLAKDDFIISVNDRWKSPESGAVYPAGWTVSIPSLNLTFQAQPLIPDQELNVSYSYWEGAVQVTGSREGQALSGSGYVELTGYAGSMGGEF